MSELNKKKRFKFKAPDAIVLVLSLMIICALLTYILPAGTYDRFTDPVTGREVVDPASYHRVENTPVGPWQVLMSIHQGMNGASSVINFLFIIGGTFGVLQASGALDALIYKTTVDLKGRETLIIVFFLGFWALGGAFLGNFEEALAFIPMQIALCLALGFDSLTGVVIGICGVAIGYMGGMMNPFTLGLAQEIAGLPLYSGFGFRSVVWFVTLAITLAYVIRYTKRIQKDPTLSISYEEDKTSQYREDFTEAVDFTGRHKIILLIFVAGVAGIIYGVINHGFYLTEMSAVFILMAILMVFASEHSIDHGVKSFVKGAGNLLYACLCVGFARGLTIIMTEGNILDVIVHGTTQMLAALPAALSAPLTFVVVSIINLFIPSGSGKAVILMPILVPMADVLGITRQTIALAYHMGDGLTNIVSPANGTLMAALAMANISWNKWMKWFWKLMLIWFAIGMAACTIAVMINYGPF